MRHDFRLDADGLRLRPFTLDDVAGLLLPIAADPVARQWSPSLARIDSAADAAAWLENRWDTPWQHEWVVEDEQGLRAGRVGLHRHWADGDVEVGYWVLPEHRGRTVATRAAIAAARYGHDVLGLPRIGLVHAVENPASCRVAESAGFALEGTARQEFEHADGRRYDYHHHARLAADPW